MNPDQQQPIEPFESSEILPSTPVKKKRQGALIAIMFLVLFGAALIAALLVISPDRSAETIATGLPDDADSTIITERASSQTTQPRLGMLEQRQGPARDAKRESDIKAMHAELEAYFAVHSSGYPSLQQLNDSGFAEEYLSGSSRDIIADPLAPLDAQPFANTPSP